MKSVIISFYECGTEKIINKKGLFTSTFIPIINLKLYLPMNNKQCPVNLRKDKTDLLC